MFLPVSDDVDNRSLPMTGIFLVLVNLLAYAYEWRLLIDDPKGDELMRLVKEYGLVPLELYRGHYELLITSMFLHGDIFHLFGNMIVLWAFCRTLENAMGAFNFLVFYLMWGCVAGYAQCAAEWGSSVPIIGASGAIAGVIGAYFIAFGARTNIKTLFFLFGVRPVTVNIPAAGYVFIWIFLQMAGQAAEAESGEASVAWYAHIGGFLAGAATMLLVKKGLDRTLVRDREGNLVFEDASAPQAARPTFVPELPRHHAASMNAPPTSCPYCKTPLAEQHQISSSMFQCPSPRCARLIMLH